MFSLFYDLVLLLFTLCVLPKWVYQRLCFKKYQHSLLARLGVVLPSFVPQKGQSVIWIHAVSVGEVKAIVSLFYKLRNRFPNDAIVISTTTETGQAQAKRSMPEADSHFFLPLDFSWSIRRLMKRINPKLLILCESDFWYHVLYFAKKRGAKTAVVNGKISKRSFSRFLKMRFFAKKLFSLTDLFCVQNLSYHARFAALEVDETKLHVTGNIKFDAEESFLKENLRTRLGIANKDPVVVIGSTHDPEEEWLISALLPLWEHLPDLHLFLVPRHPERFAAVAALLQKKQLQFVKFSDHPSPSSPIILVDAMGWLQACYQIADLAIVGGSFVPGIGGHNVYEPVVYHVPILFGPHMEGQPDLAQLVSSAKAGRQVGLEEVYKNALEILTGSSVREGYVQGCIALKTSVQGATERTISLLDTLGK